MANQEDRMSFRLFIYYCALVGGWAALVGWALGQAVAPTAESRTMAILRSGLLGMSLGLLVAFGLGLLVAVWNLSLRQIGAVLGRVFFACVIGAFGGLGAGALGGALVVLTQGGSIASSVMEKGSVIFGWTLTGLIVGFAVGAFEVVSSLFGKQNVGSAIKKV